MFLTGKTRSGKSHAAKRLFLSARAPRLVVDPADSSLTEVPGAVTFSDPLRATNPAGENWRTAATARFVPRDPYDLDVYDAVYRWCFEHFPRYVWLDEAGIAAPAKGVPVGIGQVQNQGAKRQIGHIACHTRPREVFKGLLAQADHLLVFQLPNVADRQYVADCAGVDRQAFEAMHAALPPHGFIHCSTAAGGARAMAPLKS